MSELQTFKNSEEWRAKLRNFLLKENRPQQAPQPKEFQDSESNRYSFDISENLKKLIEENKQRQKAKDSAEMSDNEDKENEAFNAKRAENQHNIFKDSFTALIDENTRTHEVWNESFEALEEMCNKTASDPNSTLFKYLQENKMQIRLSPSRQIDHHKSSSDIYMKKEISEQRNSADQSIFNSVEMTQIEDVEAPSHFWDNETILHTSPVKMVGLLRPSTILECAETSDVSSAQTSFKSLQKCSLSEMSSSCYETASDTMSFWNPNKAAQTIKPEPIEAPKLIDLTIGAGFGQTDNENCDNLEESVIDLLSDEETKEEQSTIALIKFEDFNESSADGANNHGEENITSLIKFEDVSMSAVDDENGSKQITTSLIKFEDGDMTSMDPESGYTTSKNVSAEGNLSSPKEGSLHFNDTLEEVEYMMQKGLEFMASAGLTPKQSPLKSKTFPSPLNAAAKQKQTAAYDTPSSFSGNKNRHELNIKPLPKLDLFKKPMSATKSISKPAPRQKDKFLHVVSPIGTYIKQTPEAPLMSGIKTQSDAKNSSVFRELDFDSRQHRPHFGDTNANTNYTATPRSLPKKAYVSSEYRQVVDQRNAITIPGGKSVQKFLDAVMLPSVLKHEGKANLPDGLSKMPLQSNELENKTSQRTGIGNESLANFSVVAGDISIYSIQNAKKL